MHTSNVRKDAHCIIPKNAKITKPHIPVNSITGARNSKKNQ